jgi:NNP family nitrate/nitrite transporter-like MFS transporter
MMGIFGLLSGTAPNYQMLLIYRLLAGLGSGFIFPNTACIVRQWFSPRRLAMLNAMNITAPAVGISLVLYSAPSIYSVIGWRPALFKYAAIPVFFAVFWSVIGKEKQQPSSMSVQRSSLLKTLLKKDTLLLSLNMFGANGAFSAFTTFLPSYLVNERAFTLAEAGVMTSTLTIAGIMFGFLGGVATGWVGLRKPFLWSSGILVVAGGISCVFPTGTLLSLALFSLGVGTTPRGWCIVHGSVRARI